MFLATTADQRYWNKDKKIFFLGEWCRIFDQKHIWSKLDHEVMSYHWDHPDRYYRDFQYLDKLYENYLRLLSEKLNSLHGENHSLRYWRLILSPWLYNFIEVFYDRYLSIRSAKDSKKVTQTWIPPLDHSKNIPKDFSQFQEMQFGESYNLYLYGYIIRNLGGVPYEQKSGWNNLCLPTPKKPVNFLEQLKKICKKFLEYYAKHIPKQLNSIVFVSSYLKARDLLRIQISLGQLPYPCSPLIVAKGSTPDIELRKKIVLQTSQNEFESLLGNLIPNQIPTVVIEEYADMKQRALIEFPKNPEVIFTANAGYINEGFKFWAANSVEHGTKLTGTQHGGHYGVSLWSANEFHEIKIADQYFTWGWEESGKTNVVPRFSGQLEGTKRTIRMDSQGGILWLGMSRPRYSQWMFGAPVGAQMLDYLQDQELFFNSISHDVRKHFLLRFFPRDFDWQVAQRLAESLPDLKQYHGNQSMYKLLNQNRLCIGTYNATTNLETLSANFPTIAYWNFDQWALRESAKPYFEDLCRVGIFHKTPESAARKVNEVFKNPQNWWQLSEVQDARENFCQRFARTSEKWIEEWKKELLKLAKK